MALRWFQSIKSMFYNPLERNHLNYEYSIYKTFCKTLESRQDIRNNPYFEKYAEKIADVQKITPKDFIENLEKNLKNTGIQQRIESSKINSKSCYDHDKKARSLPQKLKDLNQIMKVDAVKEKTAKEIETIWNKYHQIKNGVYAVLPSSAYDKMHSNFRKFPIFLFPLPRSQGYEFILCQYMDHSCHFTSLLNYQAYQENAPVCLTVTYFTEFLETKGIVLMRGEYDDTSLKAHEAQCLTNQLQLFYGGKDEGKLQLLSAFNTRPDTFHHAHLIADFESGLGK